MPTLSLLWFVDVGLLSWCHRSGRVVNAPCSAPLAAVPYVECSQRHLRLQHKKFQIHSSDGRHVFILRNPAWVRQLGYCCMNVFCYVDCKVLSVIYWFVIWTETAVVVYYACRKQYGPSVTVNLCCFASHHTLGYTVKGYINHTPNR